MAPLCGSIRLCCRRSNRRLAILKSLPSVSTPTKITPLGPDCNLLIAYTFEEDIVLIVQTYLEYFRLWTANHGGPWIFATVNRVHIDKRDNFWHDTPLHLECFSNYSSGLTYDHRELNNGMKIRREALADMYTDREVPTEIIYLLDAHQDRRDYRLLDGGLDCFTFVLDVDAKDAQGMFPCPVAIQPHDRKKRDEHIRMLPDLKGQSVDCREERSRRRVYDSIRRFLAINCGWETPQGTLTEGIYRTQYVMIENRRLYEPLCELVEPVEQAHGCKINYVDSKERDKWVIAVVAPNNKISEIICDLKDRLQPYGQVIYQWPIS